MVRSVRSGPRAEFCPFTQCFSRHTDKGTQIPRENPFQCRCVCHNEAHVLTRMHACEKAGSYAVKSVTKSRGPIAISPESPRLFFSPSPPFPSRPLRGRSLICNEPAPPVIILRLRDHVIIYTHAYIALISLA